jgi:hypothetical protein
MTNRTDKFPPGSCRMPKTLWMKGKKLAEPFSKTKKLAGRDVKEQKNGDRRFALCALANSAGQPTESLATETLMNQWKQMGQPASA